MRLLQLRYFIPRPRGVRLFPKYLRWRTETMGARPTPREFWDYLGWCQRMNRWGR